jgi:hypothetical protein
MNIASLNLQNRGLEKVAIPTDSVTPFFQEIARHLPKTPLTLDDKI